MLTIFLLIALLIWSIILVNYLIKKPEFMIIILCINYIKFVLVFTFKADTDFLLLNILGIAVYFNDVISLLMLMVILIDTINSIKFKKIKFNISIINISLYIFLVMIFISFIRGIYVYGFNSNFVGDLRTFGSFLICLLYCKKYSSNILNSSITKKLFRFTMNVTLIYTYFIWGLDIFGGMKNLPGQLNGILSDGGSSFRFLHPYLVIILAIYTCYLLYYDLLISYKRRISLKTLIYIFTIIIFQQRTVWIAFFLGVIICLTIYMKNRKDVSIVLNLQIVILIILFYISFKFTENNTHTLLGNLESLKNIFNNTGTYNTRTSVWINLLENLRGIDSVIGQPFGAGYTGTINWQHSPHNTYVQCIMRCGYLGFFMFFITLITIIKGSLKKQEYFIATAVATLLVFWWGYGFSIDQGVILGCAIGVLEEGIKINDK